VSEDSLLRAKIKMIVERASTAEEAAYLICYLLQQQPSLSNINLFEDDSEMQTLLREVSDEMAQMLFNYGIDSP
jgi:hypothetical protein